MPPLPAWNWRKVVQAFQNLGWETARQQGSHIIMANDGAQATLSIPRHKVVAKGTLRSLIRSAGITEREFIDAGKA